jgi:hypothetical protein
MDVTDLDREVAARLANELAQQARDAQEAGLGALAYLIEMARMEAQQSAGQTPDWEALQTRRKPPSGRG